jgi:hypothetical protein
VLLLNVTTPLMCYIFVLVRRPSQAMGHLTSTCLQLLASSYAMFLPCGVALRSCRCCSPSQHSIPHSPSRSPSPWSSRRGRTSRRCSRRWDQASGIRHQLECDETERDELPPPRTMSSSWPLSRPCPPPLGSIDRAMSLNPHAAVI